MVGERARFDPIDAGEWRRLVLQASDEGRDRGFVAGDSDQNSIRVPI